MEHFSGTFKLMFAITGSIIVSYLFGVYDSLLKIFTIVVILDYITGLLASGVEGKLSSQIGLKGIAKKIMIFTLVAVSHFIDLVIGTQFLIRNATIFFYLANEILSIIENAGRIGVPVPENLKKAVELLRNKSK